MLLANTAEGTNGATVATTDTGTGDAFDTVNIGTGHTITYDTTQFMHGATSMKHAATGTSTGGYVAYTTTKIGAAVGTIYIRFYLYWGTLPNVDVRLSTILGAAATRGAIRIIVGNFLRVTDSAGGTAVTTTTALSAATWYRVEVKLIGSATVGQAEIKLFLGDSTTPLETQTSGATLNTGGTIDATRFGNTVPALNQTYWLDDIGIADTGYLGSTGSGSTPPVSVVAASTPTPVGTTNSATTTAVTPTLPTGTASGDRVFVIQSANNTSGTTPTNWTALAKDVQIGPTGTAPGAGTGRRYLSVYYRDYDGAWTMPAFSLTSATQNTNSLGVVTLRRSAATAGWDAPTWSGVGNTASAVTAFSVATPSFTTADDAVLIICSGENDNVTASAQSLTQTGAAFASLTEQVDIGSATGNDVAITVETATVTTGATGALTHAMTLSAASEGGTGIVQQTATVPTPSAGTCVVRQAVMRASIW